MLLKVVGVLSAIIVTMSVGFYFYYNHTQDKIAILNQNIAKLEISEQLLTKTISSIKKAQIAANIEIEKVNNEFAIIRAQNTRLVKKLEEHDLGYLAAERPRGVERIVNNATELAFRCYEIISGSPLTEKEVNADTALRFNSECPELWEGPAK